MMAIAQENRFSETAFLVGHHLRWFTPGGEIDLCGHATLASAFVMLHEAHPEATQITFQTLSGPLMVEKQDERYTMHFPSYALKPIEVTPAMAKALGATPKEAYLGRDLLLIYDSEEIIHQLAPDQSLMKDLPGLLVHVSAPGADYDCVSRSFGPKLAIPEDTGRVDPGIVILCPTGRNACISVISSLIRIVLAAVCSIVGMKEKVCN